MSLHSPVLCPLGITPNLLICREGRALTLLNGPSMRLRLHSFLMYSRMMPGCSAAELRLSRAEDSGDPSGNLF